jgi:hypothetical protein
MLHDNIYISTISSNQKVALGPITPQSKVQEPWFPEQCERPATYAMLPDDVLVPFQGSGSIWDGLFSIYTLLSIFGLEDKKVILACEDCNHLETILNYLGMQLVSAPSDLLSDQSILCARYAVAGVGLLTDYRKTVNGTNHIVRGPTVRAFRDFLAAPFSIPSSVSPVPPFRITFLMDPGTTKAAIEHEFGDQVLVESHTLSSLDLASQARIIAASNILVTTPSPEALLAATFSCRGATLIVIGTLTDDWDLLMNAGYLKSHQRDTLDESAIVETMQVDLEILQYQEVS